MVRIIVDKCCEQVIKGQIIFLESTSSKESSGKHTVRLLDSLLSASIENRPAIGRALIDSLKKYILQNDEILSALAIRLTFSLNFLNVDDGNSDNEAQLHFSKLASEILSMCSEKIQQVSYYDIDVAYIGCMCGFVSISSIVECHSVSALFRKTDIVPSTDRSLICLSAMLFLVATSSYSPVKTIRFTANVCFSFFENKFDQILPEVGEILLHAQLPWYQPSPNGTHSLQIISWRNRMNRPDEGIVFCGNKVSSRTIFTCLLLMSAWFEELMYLQKNGGTIFQFTNVREFEKSPIDFVAQFCDVLSARFLNSKDKSQLSSLDGIALLGEEKDLIVRWSENVMNFLDE